MRIHIILPTIAFCAVMLAQGCSPLDTVLAHEGGNGTQVPLVIATAGIQTEVTATRTVAELPVGASIGVFLDNASSGGSYAPRKNVRYNRTDVAWEPRIEEETVYLKESDANLCAYYPFDISVADVNRAITLTPHILADDEVLPAYAPHLTANAVDKSVVFSMKQAYSWLVLSFVRGDIKDDITLSEFSLTNAGLYKESVLDIRSGVVDGTVVDGGTITFSGEMVLTKNGTVVRNIVLPPGELSDGLKVSIKVKEYDDKVLSTTLSSFTTLAEGYKYAVTLTVEGTDLGSSSVKLLPWTETAVNDEGSPIVPMPNITGIRVPEAEIKLGVDCSAEDKASLAKLIWARGNLSQADDEGWGPIKMAFPTDYGHYYTYKSEYSGEIGTTDPCSTLSASTYGTGWRTPSRAEFEMLFRCTDKQLVSHNGTNGMWFMNNKSGLFLPAAGFRSTFDNGGVAGSGTTATQEAGTNGLYWSSNVAGRTTCYYLGFSNDNIYTTSLNRDFGMSVRCVKEDN